MQSDRQKEMAKLIVELMWTRL